MLGIGQITTRIAELIRGAMPYAIVNNDPNQSRFSKLISFSEVQRALDDGHKWIKVKASDVDYNNFTVSTNYTTLESSMGARFTNTNTATAKHVIVVSADYCLLTGFRTYTEGGATGASDRRGFNITGEYNIFIGCRVDDSDASAFAVEAAAGGVGNRFIGCIVAECDDYGFYIEAKNTSIIGCIIVAPGTGIMHFTAAADNCQIIGNMCLNSTNIGMAGGSSYGVCVGNLLDGGISVATGDNWEMGTANSAAPGANRLY